MINANALQSIKDTLNQTLRQVHAEEAHICIDFEDGQEITIEIKRVWPAEHRADETEGYAE